MTPFFFILDRWLKDFGDIHTYIFMFLAIGLFLSVKFFVSELKKAQASGSLGKAETSAQTSKKDS